MGMTSASTTSNGPPFPMRADRVVTLYHGTTEDAAGALLSGGWKPNSGRMGGNCGDPRLLYLTTEPENALWFAQEKGGSTVLAVQVPIDSLIVDPEDGSEETVEEELRQPFGIPGSVACTEPLPASTFSLHDPTPSPSVP